jgi:hypothetical protein
LNYLQADGKLLLVWFTSNPFPAKLNRGEARKGFQQVKAEIAMYADGQKLPALETATAAFLQLRGFRAGVNRDREAASVRCTRYATEAHCAAVKRVAAQVEAIVRDGGGAIKPGGLRGQSPFPSAAGATRSSFLFQQVVNLLKNWGLSTSGGK